VINLCTIGGIKNQPVHKYPVCTQRIQSTSLGRECTPFPLTQPLEVNVIYYCFMAFGKPDCLHGLHGITNFSSNQVCNEIAPSSGGARTRIRGNGMGKREVKESGFLT
jgi:hypothetical protein